MKKFLTLLLMLCSLNALAVSNGACSGQFPDLFADVCWDCAFPISIMGAGITTVAGENYTSTTQSGVDKLICACTENGLKRTGHPSSFWEFARQIDITRTPYCLVSMGMQMPLGINAEMYGAQSAKNRNPGLSTTFRHAHLYINPLMGLMQVALDSKCLEPKGFDLFWMSELDPTWSDEEMARILTPDAYLFGNIVADLACAGDCLAATAGLDTISNMLYFCAGCNGTLYPLDGYASSIYSGVQMSSLYAQRVMAKMHRMLVVPSMAGAEAMCGAGIPQITMDKRQYKFSMLYPVPQASPQENSFSAGQYGSGGILACCQPFGRSTLLWGAGREIPSVGEDFAYGIFRKRDCCQ